MEGGVALGMGEDGGKAGELELVEGFGEAGRQAVVGDFDEQVVEAVDAEAGGVCFGLLDVVEGDMEVAAAAEGEGDMFGCEDGRGVLPFLRRSPGGLKSYWPLAWGVQTMWVMPSAAANFAMATEVSRLFAPSSRPKRR